MSRFHVYEINLENEMKALLGSYAYSHAVFDIGATALCCPEFGCALNLILIVISILTQR